MRGKQQGVGGMRLLIVVGNAPWYGMTLGMALQPLSTQGMPIEEVCAAAAASLM